MEIENIKDRSISLRLIYWLCYGDVGASSLTMAKYMFFDDTKNVYTPGDSSDFRRCYELVKLIPELRYRFDEMSKAIPKWKKILDHWDIMSAILEKEIKDGSNGKILYDYLRNLEK